MKNPLHKFVAARQSDTLMVYAYDVIGNTMFGDGVTASAVAEKLSSAGDFKRVEMHINSPGGDPFEAVAISNLLKQQGKPIDVIVDGLAASAASVLAMAGSTITMGEGSMFMIHNAASVVFGNAADMRAMADTLEKVSGTLAETYASRTKLPVDEVKALMAAETWLTASQAVAKGFADKVVSGDGKAVALAASFDLSVFRHTPVELRQACAAYTGDELKRYRLQIA